jgi:hypothetical protein
MRGQEPVPQPVMVKVIAFLAEREQSPAPAIDTPENAEEKRNLG